MIKGMNRIASIGSVRTLLFLLGDSQTLKNLNGALIHHAENFTKPNLQSYIDGFRMIANVSIRNYIDET